MYLLDAIKNRLSKLYNIEELLMMEYNPKLKCFRYEYNLGTKPWDEDYAPLSGVIDKSTALRFITYAKHLLEKDNYTVLEMNEVFIAWLYVNELEILGV